MDGSKRIAVITRTRNRPVLLKRALNSVQSQSYENFKQFIINDNGDENIIRELLAETNSDLSRVHVETINTDGHMEEASNIGLLAAQNWNADYVVIHDDDDSWSPEFLSTSLRELLRYQEMSPSIRGVICKANMVFERISGNIIIPERLIPHATTLPEIGILRISDILDDHCNFAPIQFLYELDAAVTLGKYDRTLRVYGDWDFNLRFLAEYDIGIIPNYLAFYHQRVSSSGANANSIQETERSLQRELYRQLIQNKYLRSDSSIGLTMTTTVPNQMRKLQALMQTLQTQFEGFQEESKMREERLNEKRTRRSRRY